MRRFTLLAAALVALAGLLPTIPAGAAAPALFGTAEFRADSLAALPQWRRVLDRMAAESGTLSACARASRSCPSPDARDWLALLRRLDGEPRWQQLRAVNRFANSRPYRSDGENYGRSDYWATPLEFLRRSGDCEDYAIIKYTSLRRLGWPAEQLRLVVLKDVVRDLPHAVLAAYLGGTAYILDNLTDAILPQERITHYVPYYSINEVARWAHAPQDSLVVTTNASTRP